MGKILLHYWNEFISATNLQVIRLLARSQSKLATSWWFSVFILTGILTFRGVTRQIETFLSDPTATKVHLKQNKTVEFADDPTLCIEVDIPSFKNEKFSLNETETLVKTNEFNDKRITFLLSRFLGLIAYYENSYRGDNMRNLFQYSSYEYLHSYYELKLTNWLNSFRELYPILFNRSDFDLTKLKYKVGTELCKIMQIKVTVWNSGDSEANGRTEIDPCQTAQISWFGSCPFDEEKEQICIRLPKKSLLFTAIEDSIEIHMETTDLYENKFSDDDFRIYLLWGGERVASNTPFFSVNQGDTAIARGDILGHYKILNRPPAHPCTSFPRQECHGQCVGRTIFYFCKCWPVSWAPQPDLERLCFMDIRDMNCLKNLSTVFVHRVYECQKLCRNRCDTLRFQFRTTEILNKNIR